MKRSKAHFTVYERLLKLNLGLRAFKENVYYACEEIESSNLGYVNPQSGSIPWSIHSFRVNNNLQRPQEKAKKSPKVPSNLRLIERLIHVI